MAGPPVIQPKAGAVKTLELSPYYSIYISWSLSTCSLGFALSTLSLHYIYINTLKTRRSFARVCYSHSLSPSSPDLNKTALWPLSLSPPSQTTGEGGVRIPSHREGEEVQRSLYRLRRGRQSTTGRAFLFHPAPVRAGGPPTPSSSLPYVVWADPTSRHTPCHILTTLRYKFLPNLHCSSCMWIFFDSVVESRYWFKEERRVR